LKKVATARLNLAILRAFSARHRDACLGGNALAMAGMVPA